MPSLFCRLTTFQILPDSWACRLFVLTVVVETTIDLAIEGDLLVRLKDGGSADSDGAKKMPVYLSIFALAQWVSILFLIVSFLPVGQYIPARSCSGCSVCPKYAAIYLSHVSSCYRVSWQRFTCSRLFNLLFLIYAIIQIGEIQNSTTTSEGLIHIPVSVLTNIIPAVISAAEIAYIALGWKIYNEFGWKVYKFLGADRRIKKMYASYQIFQCLVKFDLFFWVGFSVQFLWLVLQKDDWEYYVTLAALPLSVVLLIEGHLAARYENKWMMATFMSGCIGALVYFIYKVSIPRRSVVQTNAPLALQIAEISQHRLCRRLAFAHDLL